MSQLKKLVHEIHRRSLWQVLGIYVVAGWLVLQAVDTLAGALNLPDWAPPFALFLLIIGLPIVLGTAFVQEGVGLRESTAPAEGEAAVDGEPRPGGRHHGLLTWRNALLAGVGAFALLGVATAGWLLFYGGAGSGVMKSSTVEWVESIAVLPFADMSPEGDQEYFSDGMTEEILDALAKVPGLRVAARTSSFQFKGQNPDVRDVGEKLGVEAVLEGSVRRSEQRLRITAQLVSAEDGFHLWSETYDRQLADIFAVQEEIARAIVEALRVQLPGGGSEPLVKEKTADLEAYNLYLRGRYVWNQRTKEGMEQAAEYFQQAVERDSTYAKAYSGLADAYTLLESYGYMPTAEALPRARAAAEAALRLDETLAEAHTSLAQTLMTDGDWEAAEREFLRAVELNPSYATAHHWYSILLASLGQTEEALREIRLAHELDPLSPIISYALATHLAIAGDDDAAIAQLEKTIELAPDFENSYGGLSAALFQMGQTNEALQVIQRGVERNPRSIRLNQTLAQRLYDAHDYEGAIAQYEKTIELAPDNADSHDRYSDLLMTLGRPDQAVREARRALELNPGSPSINRNLAWHLYNARDYEGAIAQFEATVELAPGDATTHANLSFVLSRLLHLDEAVRAARRAQELNPRSPWVNSNLAGRLFDAHEYDAALEQMERAIELAPDDASTRSSYAYLLARLGRHAEAVQEQRRALELDPRSPSHNRTLGNAMFFAYDYEGAIAQYEEALELASDDWGTYGIYSRVLSALGRTDEALRVIRSAYVRDTLSALLSGALAWRLRSARDYDAAIAQFEKTLTLKPNDGDANYGLALTYAEKGAYEEALRASQKAVELLDPADENALLGPAYVYARSGQRAKALELAEQMEERHVDPGWIGTVYAALGETDRAFERLDRASEEKAWSLVDLKQDPRFDPLRSDPRFAALLEKTGLEE